MKDEPRSPLKHQHDHAVPTVIHHPEEDLPLLARWLHRAMANPTRFWSLLVGLVVVVLALTVLVSGFSMGKAASDEAWTELDDATTADQRVQVAQRFPNTPAERWALLQAASEFYNKGFNDLPANRDAAGPELTKALQYFEEVAKKAPKDSPQARAGAFGVARTYEARNQLQKAIEQYEYVAKTWPDSDEAAQSKRLVELLKEPATAAFYKELYAFKPVETTLPPMGQGSLSFPPGHPSVGGGKMPSLFSPLLPPPPPPSPSGTSSPAGNAGSTELPADVFAPPAAAAPATPAKAAETKP